jgi:hypothetical protein
MPHTYDIPEGYTAGFGFVLSIVLLEVFLVLFHTIRCVSFCFA